jgi:hypothetical protein
MAGKKFTRVRAHIRRSRRTPEKTTSKEDKSPIERIVDAEVDAIIRGRQRKIS